MSFCDSGADGNFWWKQEEKQHASKRMTVNLDFEQWVEDGDREFSSSEMEAYGRKWQLSLYQSMGSSKTWFRVTLESKDVEDILHMKAFATIGRLHISLEDHGDESTWLQGPGFMKTSDILDPAQGHLVGGNLKIVVYIPYLLDTAAKTMPCWRPKDDDTFKNLWRSRQYTDIAFMINGKEIPAHKCVLQEVCASHSLMDLVSRHSMNDPIEINGVDPLLFETAIAYVYTGYVPDAFTKDVAKVLSLLDIANKFGLTSLKLKLDFELATHLMTPANAAELFVFADSRCCALLRETTMKQLNNNPEESKKSEGWKLVQESLQLMEDLWNNAAFKHPETNLWNFDSIVSTMSVSSLHHALEEVDLDLDGSRDMLVMRLKSRLGFCSDFVLDMICTEDRRTERQRQWMDDDEDIFDLDDDL